MKKILNIKIYIFKQNLNEINDYRQSINEQIKLNSEINFQKNKQIEQLYDK